MDDNKIYESRSLEGSIEMSGKRDKNKNKDNCKTDKIEDKDKKYLSETELEQILKAIDNRISESIDSKTRKINIKSILAICVSAISIVAAIAGAVTSYVRLENKIDNLCERMDRLETRIGTLETDVDDIKKYLYEDGGVQDQLGTINSALNIKVIAVANEETIDIVDGASIEKKDVNYVTSSFTDDTCIGVDTKGNVYLAEDLIDETVLLTYNEDDKEIFFLGQYNKEYHWNGYCVTNAYNSDGSLYGICESNFDDGNRLDYISFYNSGNNEWTYSNRKIIDKQNTGVTKIYSYIDQNVKDFTSKNVRRTDVLYADKYIENIQPLLIKYYKGNTVDGSFDDSTGNAYEVTYNNDGTVRLLYVGNFSHGYCNDSTGKAFSIAYSDEYGAYFCNKGIFSQGYAKEHSVTSISKEEINDLLKNYNFKCALKWK